MKMSISRHQIFYLIFNIQDPCNIQGGLCFEILRIQNSRFLGSCKVKLKLMLKSHLVSFWGSPHMASIASWKIYNWPELCWHYTYLLESSCICFYITVLSSKLAKTSLTTIVGLLNWRHSHCRHISCKQQNFFFT